MLSAQYDLETIERHAFADGHAEIARLAGLALDADEEARQRIKELEEAMRELHAALRNAKRIGNREEIEAAVAKLDEIAG